MCSLPFWWIKDDQSSGISCHKGTTCKYISLPALCFVARRTDDKREDRGQQICGIWSVRWTECAAISYKITCSRWNQPDVGSNFHSSSSASRSHSSASANKEPVCHCACSPKLACFSLLMSSGRWQWPAAHTCTHSFCETRSTLSVGPLPLSSCHWIF